MHDFQESKEMSEFNYRFYCFKGTVCKGCLVLQNTLESSTTKMEKIPDFHDSNADLSISITFIEISIVRLHNQE